MINNPYGSELLANSQAKLKKLQLAMKFMIVSMTLGLQFALLSNLVTQMHGLLGFSILLMTYLMIEIRSQSVFNNQLILINPAVANSIFTFIIPFGITNFIYLLPKNLLLSVGLEPMVTPWMNQLMVIVIFGSVSMWVGYNSKFGSFISSFLGNSNILRRVLSSSTRLNMPALYLCLLISLVARLWKTKMGIYGYSSVYDRLIEAASYIEYLSIAESLGKLALLGVAMQCFASKRPSFSDRYWLWSVLAYELLFGFLSGFKGAVITPLIIVGVVYFSQRKRFPYLIIPVMAVGLLSAYAIIEPFRYYRNTEEHFTGTSFSSIASAMSHSTRIDASINGNQTPTSLLILARSNLTSAGSQGIKFTAFQPLPKNSPNFLQEIVFAPVHALVPRFLWSSKPLENTGLWYSRTIIGLEGFSSTAMSPFTYLFFAGGTLAVIIGFWVVGVLQRGTFDGLLRFGNGGMMVHLGLLGVLSQMEHSFSSFITNYVRLFPMMVVAQYFLLQRPSVSAKRAGTTGT